MIDDSVELYNGDNVDLSTSYFEFKTDWPLNINFYLLGLSSGNIFNIIPINLIVCGNEQIQSKTLALIETNHILQKDESFEISYTDYQNWFVVSDAGSDHEDCKEIIQYDIIKGPDCNTPLDPSDQLKFELDATIGSDLIVDASTPFEELEICLRAQTKGLSYSAQILTFEICGDEQVIQRENDQLHKIGPLIYPLIKGLKMIYIPDNLYFISNRPNYPITIDLRSKIGGNYMLYEGDDVLLKTVGQQMIELTISCSSPVVHSLYLYAYTNNELNINTPLLIEIEICGYETLTNTIELKQFDLVQMTVVYKLSQSQYESYFKNNATNCPIFSYELVDQFGDPLVEPMSLIFYIKISESSRQFMIIDTNQVIESDSTQEMLIYMKATTMGQVAAIQPIQVNLHPFSELSKFVNYAPEFDLINFEFNENQDEDYQMQSIQIITDIIENDPYQYAYFTFPQIIDQENDNIEVELMDEDLYPYLSIQNGGSAWILEIDKHLVQEDDYGGHQLTIRITDDSNLRNENQYNLYLYFEQTTFENNVGDNQYKQQVLYVAQNFTCERRVKNETQDMNLGCQKGEDNEIDQDYLFCKEVFEPNMIIGSQNIQPYFEQNFDESNLQYKQVQNLTLYFQHTYIINIDTENLTAYIQMFFQNHQDNIDMSATSILAVFNRMDPILSFYEFDPEIDNCFYVVETSDDFLNLWNQASEKARELWLDPDLKGVYDYKELLGAQIDQNLPLFEATRVDFSRSHLLTIYLNHNQLFIDPTKQDELINYEVFKLYAQSPDGSYHYHGYKQYNSTTIAKLRQIQQSEESLIDQEQQRLSFYWKINSWDQNQIQLQLEFQNSNNLSQSIQGSDQIIFEILPNKYIRSKQNLEQLVSDGQAGDFTFSKNIYPFQNNNQLGEFATGSQKMIQSLSQLTFLTKLLKGAGMQDLWTALSVQQLTNHIQVLPIPLSPNVQQYFDVMSDEKARELLDTEYIYNEHMINFTDMPLQLGNFELMNFDGMNFIQQANAAFLSPIQCFLIAFVHYIGCKITKACYKKKIFRWIGMKIYKEPVKEGISRMIILCYLELIICCFISLKEMNYNELMENGKPLDIFSYIAAYITLLLLIMFPLYIIGILLKQFRKEETLNEEFKENHKHILMDVKTQSVQQASLHAFFMIRRAIVGYALVYFNHLPIFAIQIHLVASTAKVIYLIKTKPFQNYHNTVFEVINETFVCIGAMYILLYCNDNYDSDQKMNIGWLYLCFNSISLLYIVKILLADFLFTTIPEYWQTFKNYRTKQKLYQFKRRMLKMKKKIANEDPKNELKQIHYQAIKEIYELLEKKEEVKRIGQDLKGKKEWFEYFNLPLDEFKKEVREYHKQKKFVNDELDKYNQITLTKIQQNQEQVDSNPEDIGLYLNQIIEQFIYQRKIGSKYIMNQEQWKEMKKYMYYKFHLKLYNQLIDMGFHKIHIKRDTNCLPKCLAIKIYKDINKHQKVRDEISSYLLQQQITKEAQHSQTTSEYILINKERKQIDNIKNEDYWFSNQELKAAASLYNITIIQYSYLNYEKSIDFITKFEPEERQKESDQNKDQNYTPLYLLQYKSIKQTRKQLTNNLQDDFKEKSKIQHIFDFYSILVPEDQIEQYEAMDLKIIPIKCKPTTLYIINVKQRHLRKFFNVNKGRISVHKTTTLSKSIVKQNTKMIGTLEEISEEPELELVDSQKTPKGNMKEQGKEESDKEFKRQMISTRIEMEQEQLKNSKLCEHSIWCTHCEREMFTIVHTFPNKVTWLWFFILLFTVPFLAWLPFVCIMCQGHQHLCIRCRGCIYHSERPCQHQEYTNTMKEKLSEERENKHMKEIFKIEYQDDEQSSQENYNFNLKQVQALSEIAPRNQAKQNFKLFQQEIYQDEKRADANLIFGNYNLDDYNEKSTKIKKLSSHYVSHEQQDLTNVEFINKIDENQLEQPVIIRKSTKYNEKNIQKVRIINDYQ